MAGAEADQGFTVTPGKALTGSHSAGTGDMTPYGALAPEPAEGAMTWLTLGDTTLQITLDDGRSAFTARVEDDRLILSPEGDGEVWTLNGYAVKALNRSGIAAVELRLGAKSVALTTAQMPSHSHSATIKVSGLAARSNGDKDFFAPSWKDKNDEETVTTSSVGSGSAHENRPPYYALCFIMRVK